MSATDSTDLAPIESITANNHGGYVVVAVYLSLLTTLLFYIARMLGRLRVATPCADDWLLTAGMALAIAQTACIQQAVFAGLGRRGHLSQTQLHRMERFYYAALMLNILAQACAKASVNMLFYSLKPFRFLVIACFATLAITVAWAFASVMAIAFECKLPSPWLVDLGRCMDLQALHTSIDIVNIVSEVLIILLPVALMPKVQTNWSVRLLVIGCFAIRAVVVATCIGQLVAVPMLAEKQNIPWAYVIPTVWMQCTMNMSIFTACIPGLQSVLARLRPGMTALTVTGSQSQSHSRSGLGRSSKPSALIKLDSYRTGPPSGQNDRELWDASRMEVRIETGSVVRVNSQEIMVVKEISQSTSR